MNQYVVGFNFVWSPGNEDDIVLILKRKPDWQRGFLNGIGGKIEQGESPFAAMQREYLEETGDEYSPEWRRFCSQEFIDGTMVHFFKAQSEYTTAHTTTEEAVCVVPVYYALSRVTDKQRVIPNLFWLIPMAQGSDVGTFKLQ